MLKIAFIGPNRKVIKFEVENKKIDYFDEIWKTGIQIMPVDEELIARLRDSGKHNLKMMAAFILDANKGKNKREYNSCKTDEDLIEFVRKDCKGKGLLEI